MSIELSHEGYERLYSYNLTNPSRYDSIYSKKIINELTKFIGRSTSRYGRIYKYNTPRLFPEDGEAEYFTYYPSQGRYSEGNIMVWYWGKEAEIDLKNVIFRNDEEELF